MTANYHLTKAVIRQLRARFADGHKIEWADFQGVLPTADLQKQWVEELANLLTSTKWVSALSESGVGALGLFTEARRRFWFKLLPPEPHPEELYNLLRDFFDHPADAHWLAAVSDSAWEGVVRLFNENIDKKTQRYFIKEILNTLQVLSHRVASLGMEQNVVAKLPTMDDLDSPFLALNRDMIHYTEKVLHSSYKADEERTHDWKQILVMLSQCEREIQSLYNLKEQYGISLSLTLQIRNLERFVRRIKQLLLLLETKSIQEKGRTIGKLLSDVVDIQAKKYSLRRHFSTNLEFLSFKVVENTSRTGENYIAKGKKDYWNLFRKALGGGAIVAFLCWIKAETYYQKYPLFWEAFLYSLNYALGFVVIHFLKFTLATKQPAMTASTVAAGFVSGSDKSNEWLGRTRTLVTRLLRSQFVSLLGNAIIAFPVAYLVDQLYFLAAGKHIVEGIKANGMILELHPFKSLAIPHAAIAGVYLMISGLIAGYYENKWTYNNISRRLLASKALNTWFSADKLQRIVTYLDANFGAIMGNVTLGFFLGSTNAVGKLIGLPLDIRHITFASGNFGLAFSSLDNQVEQSVVIWTILGIAAIGFFNVLISFGLSVLIAVKSRAIPFRKVVQLGKALFKQLFTNTGTYFFPVEDAGGKK